MIYDKKSLLSFQRMFDCRSTPNLNGDMQSISMANGSQPIHPMPNRVLPIDLKVEKEKEKKE